MKTLPMVHLNGTGPRMLFEGYLKAYEACRDALEAIEEIEFNGRDYYPIHPDAWGKARAEFLQHAAAIRAAKDAFLVVACHVQQFLKE